MKQLICTWASFTIAVILGGVLSTILLGVNFDYSFVSGVSLGTYFALLYKHNSKDQL